MIIAAGLVAAWFIWEAYDNHGPLAAVTSAVILAIGALTLKAWREGVSWYGR